MYEPRASVIVYLFVLRKYLFQIMETCSWRCFNPIDGVQIPPIPQYNCIIFNNLIQKINERREWHVTSWYVSPVFFSFFFFFFKLYHPQSTYHPIKLQSRHLMQINTWLYISGLSSFILAFYSINPIFDNLFAILHIHSSTSRASHNHMTHFKPLRSFFHPKQSHTWSKPNVQCSNHLEKPKDRSCEKQGSSG